MSTEQPKPLTGYREVQDTKKEITVDEKRFKEELHKVSESEESQQRGKRNLKKSEEEIDEDELAAKKEQIKASGALFAMFMKDTASQDLLTPQTPQNIRASSAPQTTSQFTIEQDSDQSPAPPSLSSEAPAQAPAEQPLQAPPEVPSFDYDASSAPISEPQQGQQPQIAPPSQPQQIQQPTAQQTQASSIPIESSFGQDQQDLSQQPSTTQTPERVQKKEEKDVSVFAGRKPSKAQMQKKAEEKTPEIYLQKRQQTSAPAEKKEIATAVEKKLPEKKLVEPAKQAPLGAKAHIAAEAKPEGQIQPSLKEQEQKALEATPAPIQKATLEKPALVSEKEPLKVEGSKGMQLHTQHEPSKDKDKRDESEEKDQAPALTAPVTPISFTPPPTPPTPAYASLHPQIFELFEKMVGIMTIQEQQGVTTTTVTVNMKDSIFDGAQIILDHYSTAPNAFNVTIAASPEAQAMLNANVDNLAASFEASKLSFQINLRRPVLLEEYQAFKRKEKVGAESEPDQQEGNQDFS